MGTLAVATWQPRRRSYKFRGSPLINVPRGPRQLEAGNLPLQGNGAGRATDERLQRENCEVENDGRRSATGRLPRGNRDVDTRNSAIDL